MPHPRTKAPVQVLLVEDNASEAALVRIALEAVQANAKSCGMHLVSDGYQATDFLRRKNSYRNAPRPDLVILDLNLPQKHSLDVLREIKSDADLKRIAVLVLSSSRDERDIRTAYDQQANCCLDKPVDFDRFHDLVRAIEFFCTAPSATAPC